MTRVLIADSDRIVRSSIALLLKHKLGIRQISEIDHADLLAERLRNFSPELLLLDWGLPGFEAGRIASICSKFQYSSYHPIVVVMSTNSEIAPLAFAEGAEAFLNKRAPGDEVLALLKYLLMERY